jgi:hypothetical protein
MASVIQEPLRVVKNNGKVVLNYVMYNEEFAIVDGTLTQAAIDDLYCLSDAIPGCSCVRTPEAPTIALRLTKSCMCTWRKRPSRERGIKPACELSSVESPPQCCFTSLVALHGTSYGLVS